MQIKGAKAMIVGGASGMARATARRIASGGGKVAILDRRGSGGPAAAGEVFCAIASSSLNFGSVSASAGRYFDSYGLVKLDCENLSQQQQNAQVQLRITPGPLCPIAEYQTADGAGLVLAADAAEPQALAPLSLKPQEKLRLELTFPAQLRLGPQTRAGVLEFQCDFDVTLEPAP